MAPEHLQLWKLHCGTSTVSARRTWSPAFATRLAPERRLVRLPFFIFLLFSTMAAEREEADWEATAALTHAGVGIEPHPVVTLGLLLERPVHPLRFLLRRLLLLLLHSPRLLLLDSSCA